MSDSGGNSVQTPGRKIKWSLNVTKLRLSPLPRGVSQEQYTEKLLLLHIHVLYIRAYLDILSNNFWIVADRLNEEHLEYKHNTHSLCLILPNQNTVLTGYTGSCIPGRPRMLTVSDCMLEKD